MKSLFIAAVLTLITLPVLAVPAGYEMSSLDLGHTCSSVFLVDVDGLVYYGHPSPVAMNRKSSDRGSRAPADEIWVVDPSSGSATLLYSALNHSGDTHQIKSASGMAVDMSTVPPTYYIADQDPFSDPWSYGAVWQGQDGNSDGDIDDPGETIMVTADTAIINIEGLIRNSATGALYASAAEGTTGSTLVYKLDDSDISNFFEPGEITPYFLEPCDCFGGKLAFDFNNENVIYTLDTTLSAVGTIYRLEDSNLDGDCLDPGDWTVVTNSLGGGYGIAVDPEGDIFATGSNYGAGTHTLYEIVPGSPATVTAFDDLAAFAGWTGPIAMEPGSSFEPEQVDATLYLSYTNTGFGDPTDLKTYQGKVIDVPAMNWFGIVLLLSVITLFVGRFR